MKKIIRLLVIGIVAFQFICIINARKNNVFASKTNIDKVYCNLSIDDEFANDRVLVVLNKNYSADAKSLYNNLFSEIEYTDIIDLTAEATKAINGHDTNRLVNTKNFQKVLLLTLKVAKVTDYGRILGMNVNQDTSVYIYAVHKSNPSIIYRYQLTVLNDTKDEEIEIHSTLIYQKNETGIYNITIDFSNSPYPMIQEYSWIVDTSCHDNDINVTINELCTISTTDSGYFNVVGSYNINSRVTLIIHIVIEE